MLSHYLLSLHSKLPSLIFISLVHLDCKLVWVGQRFSATLSLEKCDPILRQSVSTAAINVIINIKMYGFAKLVILSYFYPEFKITVVILQVFFIIVSTKCYCY